MSSNKKQTTLGYVKSQTTLGRFFTLPPSTSAARPIQTKLKSTNKSGKSADGNDVASPKLKKASPRKAAWKKSTAPESDGSGNDEGNIESGVSSSEMEMSDAPGPAIGLGKQGEALEKSSTKRERSGKTATRKRVVKLTDIKKETESSESESPPTKCTKKTQTPKSPTESSESKSPPTKRTKKTQTPKSPTESSESESPPTKRTKKTQTPKSPTESSESNSESESPPTKRTKKARAPGSPTESSESKLPPTKRTKETRTTKSPTESSESKSPPTKRTKRTKKTPTPKSPKKSDSELELSDEDIKSETRLELMNPPKAPAKKSKGKAKGMTVNVNIPASPFDSAKGVKSSPISPPAISPWESRESERSLSETPSSTSKISKAKLKGKAKASGGSPTGKKSKKRTIISDSVKAADKTGSSATPKVLNSDSETEKPSLAPAAGREMIKKLSKSVPPAFPDWVAGKATPYAALVTTFSLLESTTKRLEKISHTSRFLRQVLRLSPNELLLVIHLMINKLAADFEGVEMGIGESLLMKAIGESCGRSLERIREDQRECGDLGLVAMKSRNKQQTLFAPQPLTIAVVHRGLLDIARTKGEGGQGRKVSAIRKLLAAAKGDEAKFLIRGLEGKLRLGLAERTVLVSLSSAMITHEQELSGKIPTTAMLDQSEINLRNVYSELPSYEIIIPAMMEHGIMKVKEHCKLQPGVPVKPMLAKPTKTISEVLDRFENQRFTCEYKYDGERAQIHYVSPKSSIEYPPATLGGKPIKNLAKVFSRNSEDLSGKYPDILAAMNKWVRPEVESFVLDCEAVGWDETNNRLLPFQMLQTRKKKDVALADVKIRVCVHAFDLLFLNGEPIVRESLDDRRKLMHETFTEVPNQFVFARYMDSSDLEEIRLFLDQSVKDSCEGLMVKMMDGTESFYEPSQRSRNWLKIKKDYIDKLGDSLDLVVIGAYWGRGKRTSVYGSFLLACYNLATQNYESVCNIGTGFSESQLEEFHETLHPLEIDRAKPFYDHPSGNAGKPDVWFEPKILWEVKAADLTLSPRYKAASGLAGHRDKGVSLRFPRFIGPRTDKTGDDATSSNQIAEMYLRQDQVAHKTGAKGVDDDFEY
ncbi:unnamed protein product [Tuber aestivum]|uniref:DNA ligase n=1 Tax=Tuber aestivum TaxID=59557 RepID=A0A292Q7U3_9PEZI|nr:unnamed protein product [Tuber aestivum]